MNASRPTTECPAWRRRSERCEPMKPAAPVTRQCMTESSGSLLDPIEVRLRANEERLACHGRRRHAAVIELVDGEFLPCRAGRADDRLAVLTEEIKLAIRIDG